METAAKTATKAGDTKMTVAGKIDRDVWDKCELRAFNEDRIKTNSGIVEAALKAYAAGK